MAQFFEFLLNHWALSSSFIIVLILLIYHESRTQAGGLKLLSPTQTTLALNHEHGVVFDVRGEEEFKKGHILGAINIAIADQEPDMKKLKKYLSKPVIICTSQGLISPKLARRFREAGFEKCFALQGGIKAWQDSNLPLSH